METVVGPRVNAGGCLTLCDPSARGAGGSLSGKRLSRIGQERLGTGGEGESPSLPVEASTGRIERQAMRIDSAGGG